MNTGVKKYQVDIASNPSVIKVTAEPIALNTPETFPVAHVLQVTPVYFDYTSAATPVSSNTYNFATGPNTFEIDGNYGNLILPGDSIVISGSVSNNGTYTVVSAVDSGTRTLVTVVEAIVPNPAIPVAISAYTTSPETITIPGNFEGQILPGDSVAVSGSTNNDGTYTVISALDSGANTIVTVVETINPAVVDGTLTFYSSAASGSAGFTPLAGTVEAGQSGDSLRATYPYPRMTRLIIESHEGKKLDLELQSITNQATWSTGNRLGLNAAAAAINALL